MEVSFIHVRPKHGDTGLLEVRDSLEDRGGGQMATGVENASILVDALDIDAELLFQKVDFLIHGQWGGTGIVEIITDFLENPWPSEGGAANHHRIYAVSLKSKLGFFRGRNIAVADDWDMNAGIVLHLSDEAPVSFSGVHLATGSSVDGERLDSAIL